MLTFLHDLIERGRVTVPMAPAVAGADELRAAIVQVDAMERIEIAGEGPGLVMGAAIWGLGVIENACRFLVFREVEAAEIAAGMGVACPERVTAAVCYSADLFLRYLPDVIRLARGMGEADPLVTHLLELAVRWPMSSVGVSGVCCADEDVEAFIGDPSLRQLYLDRIAASGDVSRLGVAAVRRGMRSAIGDYPQFAPRMAEALAALPE